MYEQNAVTLDAVCAERSVIRHVSKHRNPDGTMDIAGNLKIWNDALSRFDQMLLWEDGAPGYDGRDPLQPQPSLVFVPAPGQEHPRGTVIVAHGGKNARIVSILAGYVRDVLSGEKPRYDGQETE